MLVAQPCTCAASWLDCASTLRRSPEETAATLASALLRKEQPNEWAKWSLCEDRRAASAGALSTRPARTRAVSCSFRSWIFWLSRGRILALPPRHDRPRRLRRFVRRWCRSRHTL